MYNGQGWVNVILTSEMWFRRGTKDTKCVSRNQALTGVEAVSKLSIALLYNRMSKERRKGNPQTTNILSSSSLEKYFMFRCTNRILIDDPTHHWQLLINNTTPHHQILQHPIIWRQNFSDHSLIILNNATSTTNYSYRTTTSHNISVCP